MILPNYGEASSPAAIRRIAAAAEELGFESVWATEHIIVGREAVDPYGRVYDPLVTLGWIAGWTGRIGLGTSIVLVPLHNPMRLAKEVATLRSSPAAASRLGVGMGWHKDEFDFMGVEFKGRGRRSDEAIRLISALWNGERDFDGEYWSFHDATVEPHPSPYSEIWVGGSWDRAIRRALELGDAWHPSRGSDANHVRQVKEQHPKLRVIPRTSPERVEAMLDAGAEGVVASFPMRPRCATSPAAIGSCQRVQPQASGLILSQPLATTHRRARGNRIVGEMRQARCEIPPPLRSWLRSLRLPSAAGDLTAAEFLCFGVGDVELPRAAACVCEGDSDERALAVRDLLTRNVGNTNRLACHSQSPLVAVRRHERKRFGPGPNGPRFAGAGREFRLLAIVKGRWRLSLLPWRSCTRRRNAGGGPGDA